ncbi:phospholipase-like protein, partial [Tanacetum coccineum]
LEVIFMGKKLVDEVPDTLMRLVENLEVWNDFRWGLFGLSRSAPTRYPDMFDDYVKKLSASRKLGKLDTRDLPIICRCDTTSVEEIKVKDCVISQLNSRVYKLETIIKVLGRKRKGVLLVRDDIMISENGLDYDDDLVKDYLIQEEFRVKQEEEERCRLEELKMKEALFLSSLKEEVRIIGKFLGQRLPTGKEVNGLVHWGDTFVNAEKDRPLNALNDQDMTQFLKDVTPWFEDLSRYNKAPNRVHLTDAFDIFLGRQGPLRARFPWYKDVSVDRRFWETLHVELWVNYMWHVRPQDADWAMVGGYCMHLLLQDTIPLWYLDGSRYKVVSRDVDQVFMPINEMDQHWCLAQFDIRTGVVTFYGSGITYDPEWREWLAHGLSLHVFNPIQTALAYRERMA